LPFGPYYIQELGVHDPAKIKFWVALFGAGPPLSFAIFSPIWGTLADRYGRRLMLLRANFGGMVILGLMGTVFGWAATASSVGWFLAPIMSGLVAAGFGIRSIYVVEAFLFVGFLPLISWVTKTLSADNHKG
jgi:MFS family permease